MVRELTGGVDFGARTRTDSSASDLCEYSVAEIERVVRRACTLARARRKHVVSVDKANVLETSRLWRDVATRVARDEFPDVTIEHQLVDSMATVSYTHLDVYKRQGSNCSTSAATIAASSTSSAPNWA